MEGVAEVHVAALQRVPLFADLPPDCLTRLAHSAREIDVADGTVLVREGERGEMFFLVLTGTARVERDGQVVSRLGQNQFVGEMSLLDGKPRMASVMMDSAGTVLTISKDAFDALMESEEFRDTLFAALCDRIRDLQAPHRARERGNRSTPPHLDELYVFGELYDVIDACETLRSALRRLERHRLLATEDAVEAESSLERVVGLLEDATSTVTGDTSIEHSEKA
jgi:CRP-like cAMP-binding protein